VIYRDLKPDNIGFDYEGAVKIFDFGLAKELDPRQKNPETGMYKMSGGTGSRRFMAPEVATSQPYHLSADMYSYSIVTWEILTLSKAFGKLSPDEHRERVITGGERLPLNEKWSPSIQGFLQKCWHVDPLKRPTAREAVKTIRKEINYTLDQDVNRNPDLFLF
jgi:serine/threonine protein kinase